MKQSLLILLLLAPLVARAQGPERGRIFFDALPFAGASADSVRLDLYLSIPYGVLSFERKEGGFAARYQARLQVNDAAGRKWLDTTFVRTVEAATYSATVGEKPAYEFYQLRVNIPPGDYTASTEVMDLRNSIPLLAKRPVTATRYSTLPFGLSGLMLVGKIREDSGGYVITPMISENVGPAAEHYFLFFETYNTTGRDSFRIVTTYRDKGRDNGKRIGEPQAFGKHIPAGRSQQWIRLATAGIPRGAFTVEMRVTPADDTARTLATAERMVRFEGEVPGVPLEEEELDERIAQLRYVASQSEIEAIRGAGSLLERQKLYGEFWGRIDPTAGTPANEAMEEYFRRIDYAQLHFRSYAAGWLTDKGRIYVIYGPPDNIATDPFRNDGRTVENWHYYRRNLKLVFVDESGFGDFRLITPVSPGERFRYGS